ncbi:MAG: hypothetical protein AAGA48_35120 [Myxococcota bacterium]
MLIWLAGSCIAPFAPDPVPVYPTVVFDPGAGDVPLPTDLLWDGRLAFPVDEATTEAEADVWSQLNQLDGWSTASAVIFETSHPVRSETVRQAVQIFDLRAERRIAVEPRVDGTSVTVPAPDAGWPRGGELLVVVQGGPDGLLTEAGPAGPDVAMGYLAAETPLTDHPDAFVGTFEERKQQAQELEAIRVDWASHFEWVAARGIPRAEVAALWPFHVTARGEVAMDADSGQVPLPADLLIDPVSQLVDLPPDPEDDVLRRDAKAVVNTLRGFSITGRLLFDVRADLDPAQITPSAVQLWELSNPPTPVPVTVSAWREDGPCSPLQVGCRHVVIDPGPQPLRSGSTYGVVVRRGITTRDGQPLAPMPTGMLLTNPYPLVDEAGRSQVASVADADAQRLEPTRRALAPLVEHIGRDDIVTGWTVTTLDQTDWLAETVDLTEALRVDPTPTVTRRRPASSLLEDDALTDLFPGLVNPAIPLYAPRTDGIAEVIEGTLLTPYHLDPVTRRWRDEPVMESLPFMATVPEGVSPNESVPVVMFGHGVTTDRRWLLTVAGPLARRGFAAVAIDLPFHGLRTVCVDRSLVAVPNPFPDVLRDVTGLNDDLIQWPPCPSGADGTCASDGRCLDPKGRPEPFSALPLVDLQPASGAAFLDTDDLPHIPDHFRQALVDLGALRRSLQRADWEAALGQRIETDRFRYLGQSLGGILGVVYVASDPTVSRAVFNVTGGGLVDVFEQSTFFAPQLEAYLNRIDVAPGTWEHEQLIHVAHWLIDTVDPLVVAPNYADLPVAGLIQIDRIDDGVGDFVIPNATSDVLQRATGLPMSEYPSVLHGDLAIPVVGDAMLAEAADFLVEP